MKALINKGKQGLVKGMQVIKNVIISTDIQDEVISAILKITGGCTKKFLGIKNT